MSALAIRASRSRSMVSKSSGNWSANSVKMSSSWGGDRMRRRPVLIIKGWWVPLAPQGELARPISQGWLPVA